MTAVESFDDVYRRHYVRLVAEITAVTLSRPAAEDAVQEAFARAWRRWHCVSSLDQPDAWVRRAAVNYAVSAWRRQRTALRYRHVLAESEAYEISADSVDLLRGLRQLPPRARAALILTSVVGMTTEEVAEVMGTRPATVRSWLHRGRRAFMDAYVRESERQ